LDYVQKSIQKDTRSSTAFNLRGVILNQLGQYSEAIESFQNALRLVQNDIITSVNLSVAYINNKEFDKARLLLEKILPLVQDQMLKDKINEYLEIIKKRD